MYSNFNGFSVQKHYSVDFFFFLILFGLTCKPNSKKPIKLGIFIYLQWGEYLYFTFYKELKTFYKELKKKDVLVGCRL